MRFRFDSMGRMMVAVVPISPATIIGENFSTIFNKAKLTPF